MRAVEVAVPFDDVEMVKRGFFVGEVWRPAMERRPQGLVVPMPKDWFAISSERKLAEERVEAAE